MDKPLSDINKDNDGKPDELKSAQPASPEAVPDTKKASERPSVPDSPLTNPLNNAYSADLTHKKWQEGLRWDASPLGRAGIRLFSRGGLGAAAFVAGGYYVTKGGGMAGYRSTMKFSEISPTKPMQYVARSIDFAFGQPIKFTAKLLGASEETAENLIRFRPTRYIINGSDGAAIKRGRSLGNEAVMITTDFFSASVADAAGRDIAELADPNAKHSWIDDKGNIDYGKATKQLGKNLWRYVSYNGGEDWFAAVPYAYYMKGQRKVINHFSPGFSLDFDRAINGGSFKVDEHANPKGNYLAAGLVDFQGRFTAYNVLTLMGRELYNLADDKIHHRKSVLYGSPNDPANQNSSFAHNVGNVFKWGARSVVKGVIYMTPAVPFFSVFRTTQHKSKGLFINPDDGSALAYKKPSADKEKLELLHADELIYGDYKRDTLPQVRFYSADARGAFHTVNGPLDKHPLSNPNFTPYNQGEGNFVLNNIGKFQGDARDFANRNKVYVGLGNFTNRSIDNYVNAAISYTPYMYVKAETARLWDDGKMDAASERMIDGIASLNMGEFKAGAGEVWRSILRKPFEDKKREIYAEKRIDEDTSPADNLTAEQSLIRAKEEPREFTPSWRERVHSAPVEKPKPKSEANTSYADQEAMRKALQELQPPTNSIH